MICSYKGIMEFYFIYLTFDAGGVLMLVIKNTYL